MALLLCSSLESGVVPVGWPLVVRVVKAPQNKLLARRLEAQHVTDHGVQVPSLKTADQRPV